MPTHLADTRTLKQVSRCPPLLHGLTLSSLAMSVPTILMVSRCQVSRCQSPPHTHWFPHPNVWGVVRHVPLSWTRFWWASFGSQEKPRLRKSDKMSMHIISDFLRRGFSTSEASDNTSNEKNWCMCNHGLRAPQLPPYLSRIRILTIESTASHTKIFIGPIVLPCNEWYYSIGSSY